MRKLLLLVSAVSLFAFLSVPGAEAAKPAIIIDSLGFSESGKALKTLTADEQEIYKPDDSGPLEITLGGQIFGGPSDHKQLLTIVLPTLQQNIYEVESADPAHFSVTISAADLPFEQPIQLMLFAQEASPSKVISFVLKREGLYPRLSSVFWEANRSSTTLLLVLALFIIGLVMLIRTPQKGLAKAALLGLVVALLCLLIYQSASMTMAALFRYGLLKVPGQEFTLQKRFPEAQAKMTLTRLNDNLEIVPALASSWSNISPTVWEFVLRENAPLSADSIVSSLRQQSAADASNHQYLSSLEKVISFNGERLQFITGFPDPLLAQKLTKVDLQGAALTAQTAPITETYLPRDRYPDHNRSLRNGRYSGLPFLSQTPYYFTELYSDNVDQLKKLIEQQSVDVFDEPEPILWPTLSKNNYLIQPKINTGSLILMTNRNSPLLKNPTMISALRKIISSPRILQTSYFQYGRLADQFAPPGVVGYLPGLTVPDEPRSATALLEQAKKELNISTITLNFQYPVEEETLAKAIEAELNRAGITVVTQAIASNQQESSLESPAPELSLLAVDFDLADIGPFLDALIDSHSLLNHRYHDDEVDQLIAASRSELNSYKRLDLLQKIMKTIVIDDPAGIPLLFKKSFIATKKTTPVSWLDQWLQKIVLGW